MSNLLDAVERVAERVAMEVAKAEAANEGREAAAAAAAHSTSNDSTTTAIKQIIPQAVIRAASEYYRILAFRIPMGKIPSAGGSAGTIHDSDQRRAAVLLHYCAKKHQQQQQQQQQQDSSVYPLSWSLLGKAIRVKQTHTLEQLLQKLLHFMQPTQTMTSTATRTAITTTTSAMSHPGNDSNQRHNRSGRHGGSGASAAGYQPRILPQLVIRLSGFVLDPHGIQQQAMQLLQDMYTYYDTDTHYSNNSSTAYFMIDARERRGHLYDLNRLAGAYEAAALYHVVTTTNTSNAFLGHVNDDDTEQVRTKRKADFKTRPGSRGKFSKTNDEALDLHNDGETATAEQHDGGGTNSFSAATGKRKANPMMQSLQLSDVLDAANDAAAAATTGAGAGASTGSAFNDDDFTYLQLQEVLTRVQELARSIKSKKEATSNRTSDANAASKPSRTNDSSVQTSQTVATTKAGAVAPKKSLFSKGSLRQQQQRTERVTVVADPAADSDSDDNAGSERADHRRPSLSLAEWKDNVLRSALEQARDEHQRQQQHKQTTSKTSSGKRGNTSRIRKTPTTSCELLPLSDAEAMEWAADAVLRRYGIGSVASEETTFG